MAAVFLCIKRDEFNLELSTPPQKNIVKGHNSKFIRVHCAEPIMMATIATTLLIIILALPCWAFNTNFISHSRRSRHNDFYTSSSSIIVSQQQSSSSRLFSLQPLIEEIVSSTATDSGDTPVIFVGGKGGVGKTSVSSALAVELGKL